MRKCKSEFHYEIHEALQVKYKMKLTNLRKQSFIFLEDILILNFFFLWD